VPRTRWSPRCNLTIWLKRTERLRNEYNVDGRGHDEPSRSRTRRPALGGPCQFVPACADGRFRRESVIRSSSVGSARHPSAALKSAAAKGAALSQSGRFAPIVAYPLEANDQTYPIPIQLHFQERGGSLIPQQRAPLRAPISAARLSRSRPIVRTASLRPLCR
jgi:hypothetical protein